MSSSSASSQLSVLVSLIANATKIVEASFQSSSKPFVPSLDDTAPHPLDTDVSSLELTKAVQTIEAACAQLCAAVARPNHTIVNKCMAIYEPACLHVAVTFRVPDILQENLVGMHISELSQKTGVEAGKLGRVLRLLASKHCFREVAPDVFANNRISMQLLSTNPLSNLAFHFTDENNKSTSLLAETLADPDWGFSYSPEHTAFNKYSKYPKPVWEFFEGATPEGARQGARFGVAMKGWSDTVDGGALVTQFPWGDLGNGASVCDVGGGIGNVSIQLARAHPNLKLKLQDLPERIHQAQTMFWPTECPEAIRENRIEFKAIDFFSESPIQGCDIYYLKNIIHNWPEKECIKILTGVRQAMSPNSRVLIHEFILQHANRVRVEESAFIQAPEPLLPNYGVGRIRQYNMDIDMLAMLNSQERHLEEFIRLGEAAGLKFVKLWDLGEMGMVELCLS